MKILLADDEKLIAVTLGDALLEAGHAVTVVHDGQEALQAIHNNNYDVIITDIRMPHADGYSVLESVKKVSPQTHVILITTFATVEDAVNAVKNGAYDYLQKPFVNVEVIERLKKLERVVTLEQENRKLKEEIEGRRQFGAIIGKSPRMQEVYELITAVAPRDGSILVEGESGTGKELVADAIHYNSSRRTQPLIKMSCAVFPEGLIESELFGHVKGAFTDASSDRAGRFERADKGTIFIDDIDDLQPATQVKLLRVLQEKQFERVGGSKTIDIDVRVIAATKKDLWKLSEAGEFREDLFYRLNVVKIDLPPLREREGDLPQLVDHFMRKKGEGKEYQIEPSVLEALERYSWPGNVRELEHAVERAIMLAGENLSLEEKHLMKPVSLAGTDLTPTGRLSPLSDTVAEAEAKHIRTVLASTAGHKGEAARLLGISRKNLWEKMKLYGIESK